MSPEGDGDQPAFTEVDLDVSLLAPRTPKPPCSGAIGRDHRFHRIPFPLSCFEPTLTTVLGTALTTAPTRALVRQRITRRVPFRR